MKIYVIDTKNRSIAIENITESTTIKELRKRITEQNIITTGQIKLTYNGNILEDDENLYYYDIEDNTTIIYTGEFISGK